MAMNLADVTAQTWVFPAAAATTNKSNSIFVGGLYEVVGIEWGALEATSAIIEFEVASVLDSMATADASCTWYKLTDSSGDDIQLTGAYTSAGRMSFDPTAVFLGPCRIRACVYAADGSTAVTQDEGVVYPIFRTV